MKKSVFVCGIFTLAFVIMSAFTACPNPDYPPNKASGNLSGNPPVTFTRITDFQTWLLQQPDNTSAIAYNVKLNVNNLGGSATTAGSVGAVFKAYSATTNNTNSTKYVSLDLSGSTLTGIEDNAFASCRNLTGITLPNSITGIGDFAFSFCTSLAGVTIPDKVTSIGDFAYQGCSSLTSIIIPSSVTKIGDRSFNSNTSLTSVTFQGTIASGNFHSDGFFPTTMGDLRAKFYAINAANGTPGTYKTTAPVSASSVWSKQ